MNVKADLDAREAALITSMRDLAEKIRCARWSHQLLEKASMLANDDPEKAKKIREANATIADASDSITEATTLTEVAFIVAFPSLEASIKQRRHPLRARS